MEVKTNILHFAMVIELYSIFSHDKTSSTSNNCIKTAIIPQETVAWGHSGIDIYGSVNREVMWHESGCDYSDY